MAKIDCDIRDIDIDIIISWILKIRLCMLGNHSILNLLLTYLTYAKKRKKKLLIKTD